MCSQLSARSETNAIFVGEVTDVWPARDAIADQSRTLTRAKLKQRILNRWHGKLSSNEERYIRTTVDTDALERRFGTMQRVRFIVRELLAGPRVLEVYTDASSCGFRFDTGLTYLVNASREGARYRTGACSRTARVESDDAVEDLRALRGSRTGHPLRPRIYGRIDKRDLRPDTRVLLVDDKGRAEAPTHVNPGGRFAYDDLAKSKYRLQVEDSRGRGELLLDLSRLGCFEATPFFSESWHIAGSPATVEARRVPLIADSPPLLGPSKQ